VQDTVTIEQALEAFVEDQRQRLSARTMRRYDDVVELLRHSLNGYGPNALDQGEHRRWENAFDSGDEDAFCHLFGPERILGHLPEFLGYFMVRKVVAGQELLRSAGTVTKRLAEWLYAQGYVSAEERAEAVERGTRSARDLPRAERLARLLYEQSRAAPPFDPDVLGPDDLIEDYLVIERVEPGELYFSDGVGPVTVSAQACELAEVGWGVAATLARRAKTWWVVEVGNVYPR
jgi:hypothetical protein